MSVTSNYQLYITDDNTEKFLDWRERMNGGTDSNMVKIDTILGEKADSSVAVSLTLLRNEWVGEEAPFTQELSVSGLTAEQNGSISVAHNATVEQRESAREAILSVVGQEDGSLTIAADGDVPEIDIPVSLILFG